MKKPLQIAIDGPVAAGKSDIAERLAKRLGVMYLYTGAMYRAVALACLQNKVDIQSDTEVLTLLAKTDITLVPSQVGNRSYTVLTNHQDVTDQLFSTEVSNAVPAVSAIAQVRQKMVAKQQELTYGNSVVMEGRDIGYRVLPDAQLKIFLTASIETRAQRRYEQLVNRGQTATIGEVINDTLRRDHLDSTRQADPLKKLPDEWEIDTTNLTQEQVIEKIITELKKRQLI